MTSHTAFAYPVELPGLTVHHAVLFYFDQDLNRVAQLGPRLPQIRLCFPKTVKHPLPTISRSTLGHRPLLRIVEAQECKKMSRNATSKKQCAAQVTRCKLLLQRSCRKLSS